MKLFLQNINIKNTSSKRLKTLLKTSKYFVSFTILFFLISNNAINVKNVLNSAISSQILCIAFLLNYVEYYISAQRYAILLASQKIFIKFKKILIWCLQGRFLDSFLPTSFGGDILKVYYLKKHLDKNKDIITSNNILLTSSVLTLADKAFSLSALFYISTFSFFILIAKSNEINIYNYSIYFIISLCVTLIFLFSILLSVQNSFTNSKILFKIYDIRYLGDILKESISIMQHLSKNIAKFLSIMLLSFISQIISLASLLILLVDATNFSLSFNNLDFYILFFSLVPLFYFTNIFGILGGFGIGTLGIGYCLTYLFMIENGYELVFLSQSINLLARFTCIFSYINFKSLSKN